MSKKVAFKPKGNHGSDAFKQESKLSWMNLKTVFLVVCLSFLFNQVQVIMKQTLLLQSSDVATKLVKLQGRYAALQTKAKGFAKHYKAIWEKVKHNVDLDYQHFDSMEEHFDPYFGVTPLHTTLIDPAIQAEIDAHDITQDPEYKAFDPKEIQLRIKVYKRWLDKGTKGDTRFYVKYVDRVRGYGLFAKQNLRRGDVLGLYSSFLTNNSYTSDYAWTYYSQPAGLRRDPSNSTESVLSLDAKHKGNWFRFANSDNAENLNTEISYVPYNNIWNVMYIANKPIRKHEEILVSYGEGYWESRKNYKTTQTAPTERKFDYLALYDQAVDMVHYNVF